METISTLVDQKAIAQINELNAGLQQALDLAERLDVALRRLAIPVVVRQPTQGERFATFHKKLINGERPQITGWGLTADQYETIARDCPQETRDRDRYLQLLSHRINPANIGES